MTPIYRPGHYCDVAVWIDGRLLAVTADGPLVRCFLEGVEIWRQTAPEPLLFCRGAVQGNLMLTVHQGHDSGKAWLVGEGLVRELGPTTFGVQPVGIDPNNAYVVVGSTRYARMGLVSQGYPSGAPGSSQGLSDVQPDGTLWWADVHRTMVIAGTTFTYPNVRGRVTVGQVDPPGVAVAVASGSLGGVSYKVTRVIDGDAFEPHVAVSPTGRVAICARTPQGAAYVATTIQELSP
jgi:hypothetical protein